MANAIQEAGLFNEFSEWQRKGTELRRKLLAERKELERRLKELDAALAKVPADDAAFSELPLEGADRETVPPSSGGAPALIQWIVSRHPAGVDGSRIVEEAQRVKPGLDPALVHSAVYRLVKRGDLTAAGRRGTKVYRVAASEPGTKELNNTASSGSLLERGAEIIRRAGKPLHVKDIAPKIDAEVLSLTGALFRGAKKQRLVYKDERPNTFGLLEWKADQAIAVGRG